MSRPPVQVWSWARFALANTAEAMDPREPDVPSGGHGFRPGSGRWRSRLQAVARIVSNVPWTALGAGFVASLAFPPWNFLPFAVLGVAMLYRVLRRRPEFAAGYLFGIGLLAPLMPWLSAFHFGAPFGVILLSALPYGLAARTGASPGRFASAFLAAEFARSVGMFALPWGVLGTLAATTPWRGLAAWGGVWLLSGMVWLAGALLARGIAHATLLLAFALPLALIASRPADGSGSIPKIRIAAIQGGFSMEGDYEFRPAEVRRFLEAATRRVAASGATLVAWSETVILEYLNWRGHGAGWIQELADETGASILVGAPAYVAPTEKRNSAYLVRPGASRSIPPPRYDKVHLVPFGEFLPGLGPDGRHLLLPEGTGDFSPAVDARPLAGLGVLICYEAALPNLARDQAIAGASLLVTLANDAWTRSFIEAEQHARLTMLRAVETGRPFLRAGNVGRSFLLSRDGSVVAELAPGRRGEVVGEVEVWSYTTKYMVYGDWAGWLALLGTPFLLTVSAARRDHNRRLR